jgi:hypothetical protein
MARVAEENVAEGSEMTPVSELRQEMAWAAATDAANQNMRAHGRTVWDADDYNVVPSANAARQAAASLLEALLGLPLAFQEPVQFRGSHRQF